MVRRNKPLSPIFLAILISIFAIQIGFANSAEPPSILIIVPGAPKDMVISIATGKSFSKADKIDKLTETYYTFYSRDIRMASNYNFKISTGDITYEITLYEPIGSYNNIYTFYDLTEKDDVTKSIPDYPPNYENDFTCEYWKRVLFAPGLIKGEYCYRYYGIGAQSWVNEEGLHFINPPAFIESVRKSYYI